MIGALRKLDLQQASSGALLPEIAVAFDLATQVDFALHATVVGHGRAYNGLHHSKLRAGSLGMDTPICEPFASAYICTNALPRLVCVTKKPIPHHLR